MSDGIFSFGSPFELSALYSCTLCTRLRVLLDIAENLIIMMLSFMHKFIFGCTKFFHSFKHSFNCCNITMSKAFMPKHVVTGANYWSLLGIYILIFSLSLFLNLSGFCLSFCNIFVKLKFLSLHRIYLLILQSKGKSILKWRF